MAPLLRIDAANLHYTQLNQAIRAAVAAGEKEIEIDNVLGQRFIADGLKGEVTITIHVFITADGGTLDNEACVDPDHVIDETSELDNCKTAITGVTPAVADLAVNKSADKGTVTAGETRPLK